MMFRKILGILDYFAALILLLLAFLGGYILYPIVYWFKDSSLSMKIPLWWWFDDEDGLYGAEYWRKAKGITKKNFWVSYRWCGMRNPMWNAHTKVAPASGPEIVIKAYGNLTINGEAVSLSESASIMYEDENGKYQGNAGDIFSVKHSILGWAFIWFKKEGKKRIYWRLSLAKKVYKRRWIQLQFGAFHRYIWKIKGATK